MALARWERGLNDVSQHPAILAALRSSSRIPPQGAGFGVVHLLDHGAAPYLRVLRGAADVVDLGDGGACRGEQAGLVRLGCSGRVVSRVAIRRCGCERGRGWWRSGDPSRGGQGPAASAKARPRPSLPAAAMMWPSAAAKASQGTIVGRAEPYRSGVRPVAYQPGGEAGQPGTSARRAGRRPPGRARPGLPQFEDVPLESVAGEHASVIPGLQVLHECSVPD